MGQREVNEEAGAVDESGDEGRGDDGGIDAEAAESEGEDRRDEGRPEDDSNGSETSPMRASIP